MLPPCFDSEILSGSCFSQVVLPSLVSQVVLLYVDLLLLAPVTPPPLAFSLFMFTVLFGHCYLLSWFPGFDAVLCSRWPLCPVLLQFSALSKLKLLHFTVLLGPFLYFHLTHTVTSASCKSILRMCSLRYQVGRPSYTTIYSPWQKTCRLGTNWPEVPPQIYF